MVPRYDADPSRLSCYLLGLLFLMLSHLGRASSYLLRLLFSAFTITLNPLGRAFN